MEQERPYTETEPETAAETVETVPETAETPAEPISGLILLSPFEKKFITLASSTPPAVPIAKAITPSTRMNSCLLYTSPSPRD